MEPNAYESVQRNIPPDDYEAPHLSLIAALEPYGEVMDVPKDYVLYSLGDSRLPDCYILKNGLVKAFHISAFGDEQIYNFFRSGSLLFHLTTVLDTVPDLSFVTTAPSRLVRVPRRVIQGFLQSDLRFTNLMLIDAERALLQTPRRMREAETYSVEWKICNMLLTYARRSGVEYDGKILIKERISQQLMAGMLKVSRITVARTIKELKDLSLIENINGFICIRDKDKLRSHMYYIGMPLD